MEWRDQAACRNEPKATFFPEPTARGCVARRDEMKAKVAAAKAICAGCPVRAECLADALAEDRYLDQGIRGGKTEDERRVMRRRAGQRVPVTLQEKRRAMAGTAS